MLFVDPGLKAFARKIVGAVRVIGRSYSRSSIVGTVPSIVYRIVAPGSHVKVTVNGPGKVPPGGDIVGGGSTGGPGRLLIHSRISAIPGSSIVLRPTGGILKVSVVCARMYRMDRQMSFGAMTRE